MPIRPTRELITTSDVPNCPHCNGPLAEATLTLEELVCGLGFNGGEKAPASLEGYIPTDIEGYATETAYRFPCVTCPTCQRPSLIKTDGVTIYAFPTRTTKDRAFLAARATKFLPQKHRKLPEIPQNLTPHSK